LILLDGWLRAQRLENCAVTGNRAPHAVVSSTATAWPSRRALCGATACSTGPISATGLREAARPDQHAAPAAPREHPRRTGETTVLPEKLLTEPAGKPAASRSRR